MTAEAFDVIVLGAGVGGTATTALLAHAGLRTALLEKNAVVGGGCAAYQRDGYTVDFGSHLFSRGQRGPLGEVLRRIRWPRPFEFRSAPLLFRLRGLGFDTAFPASRLAL